MGAAAAPSGFRKKLSRKVGDYEIVGVAGYIDKGTREVWEFKCVNKVNNEHILQLACCLALSNNGVGNLHLLLSGKVVRIQLDDGLDFLKTALTRFDKKIIGDLMNDIEIFKKNTFK
jgi:hypothetical protein